MFNITVQTTSGKPVNQLKCTLNQCTIGKSRDNLIQLRGWSIAQSHVSVVQSTEGIFLKDISGGSGFNVNDQKVKEFGPLSKNDTFILSNYQITITPEEKNSTEDPIDTLNDSDQNLTNDNLKPASESDNASTTNTESQLEPKEISEQEKLNKEYIQQRRQIHSELLAMMDIRRTDVADMNDEELRESVSVHISEIIKKIEFSIPSHLDKFKLQREVLNEAVGLGPLEELLENDDISEIMVNAFDDIFVEKKGKLTKSNVTFSDDNAVLSAIERIVSPLGRRIDESSPMVDARLKDGSRVNAIIPPLALKGPCITIRKFAKQKLTGNDLVDFNSSSQNMMTFLQKAVEERLNIVISGGTGSGKTTLLNVLSNFIPHDERVVTVEDAAELKLNQPHLVSLEARPANLEGKGAIPIRDLVKNCLRMRPDRIVVGECRGGEALDMLQAMNTGHDGSLTTAHANSPRDVIARLEVMVMMAGMDLPILAIREQVASAVDLIVQQTRLPDGSRKVTHIAEVTGIESGLVQLQDIFLFKQSGYDDQGKVKGKFVATGLTPYFYDVLKERGLDVDLSLFS